MSGWVLAIDFGTSNTAAAYLNETTGAIGALRLGHGGFLMPSAAYVTSPTQIDVGDIASDRAAVDPRRYVPTPKRLVSSNQASVDIVGSPLPVYRLVAAVLRTVLLRAQQQHHGRLPERLVLTYPENWSAAQIRVLRRAADEIGFDEHLVDTVSEPRAAAKYYFRENSASSDCPVAVFDFGGGTLDIAVLDSAGAAEPFRVLAAVGDDELGGRNLDAAVRRWVDEQLAEVDPQLLDLLQTVSSDHDLRALDRAVRAAKELLSDAQSASVTVAVGGRRRTLRLTRSEFEELIEPDVARAIELTGSALADAGITAADDGLRLYLTGGSSRVPLVQRCLRNLASVATLDDPKTVVAQGALIGLPTHEQDNGGDKLGSNVIDSTTTRIARTWLRRSRNVLAGIVIVSAVTTGIALLFDSRHTSPEGGRTTVARGPGSTPGVVETPTPMPTSAAPPPSSHPVQTPNPAPPGPSGSSTGIAKQAIPPSFDGIWAGSVDSITAQVRLDEVITIALHSGDTGGTWQVKGGTDLSSGCAGGRLALVGVSGNTLHFTLSHPGICAEMTGDTVELVQQDESVLSYSYTNTLKRSTGKLTKS